MTQIKRDRERSNSCGRVDTCGQVIGFNGVRNRFLYVSVFLSLSLSLSVGSRESILIPKFLGFCVALYVLCH
jgi:hypothetical protein